MVTGYGKTRAHLHRFKLLESASRPCDRGDQTTDDHLLYHCTLLQNQRKILKKDTLKNGNWPVSKHDLITKHLKSFLTFTNSTDFDNCKSKLRNHKEPGCLIALYLCTISYCKGNAATESQSGGRPLHLPLTTTKYQLVKKHVVLLQSDGACLINKFKIYIYNTYIRKYTHTRWAKSRYTVYGI
jgi:hypothetical protein